MSSPDSLTRCCLSPLKAIWKLSHAYLTSLAIYSCSLWSAALLSAGFQVSWKIQDARTFVVRRVLGTSPLRTAKAASPSVWGRIAFGRIGQHV